MITKSVTVPLVCALGVGAFAVGVGARLVDGVIIGFLALVLVLAVLTVAPSASASQRWPEPRTEASGRRGDISVLRAALGGPDGRATAPLIRRLRATAIRRLEHHGLDVTGVSDPTAAQPLDERQVAQAREILGGRAWHVLASRRERPSIAEVAHCIDRIEQLGTAHTEGQ